MSQLESACSRQAATPGATTKRIRNTEREARSLAVPFASWGARRQRNNRTEERGVKVLLQQQDGKRLGHEEG